MNTMFKHRILAGAVFFTTLLGISSCEDNIGLQVTPEAPYADKTLYEVIANDNQLTDFLEVVKACSIEERDLADSLLNKARVYTVWAPVNGSFDKAKWLGKVAAGDREEVLRTFVLGHIANHLRPANGNLEKGNLVMMLNNKMSSFEGTYADGEYTFDGRKVIDRNERVWNGLLHKIKGASEYRNNIWEFLKVDASSMGGYRVDAVADFLYSFNETVFNPNSSILGPIKDGAQTYLDSVFDTTNKWLNVGYGVGPLDAEDSLYTVYVPTNDAWNAMLAEAKKYYRYDYKQNMPTSMDSAYIDSLMNHYPSFNVIKYISYSQNEQRYVTSPDSAIPAHRSSWERPRFALSQLEADVKFTKELSNGTFKIVGKVPYSVFDLWHDTIKVEGENDEMRVNTTGSVDYIRSASENEINPELLGTKISGSRYYEGYSEQNKVTLQYRLPNVLSAKYQVAMVIVPKHITNPTVKEEEIKPTMFNVTIKQAGASDLLYFSMYEIENDPTRVDTIFLNVEGTDKRAVIEFPYCEYYNTNSNKDFSVTMEIASDNLLDPKGYDLSIRLDEILLIPVLGTEK